MQSLFSTLYALILLFYDLTLTEINSHVSPEIIYLLTSSGSFKDTHRRTEFLINVTKVEEEQVQFFMNMTAVIRYFFQTVATISEQVIALC